MIRASIEHLKKSKETYVKHLIWAVYAGIRLIWAGIASIIHAVVPGFFPGTAAKTVIEFYHKRLSDHPNQEYRDYINKIKNDE